MNKVTTQALTHQEARHKAQANLHLAEAQRILRKLATERRRSLRKRAHRASLTNEVRAILQVA